MGGGAGALELSTCASGCAGGLSSFSSPSLSLLFSLCLRPGLRNSSSNRPPTVPATRFGFHRFAAPFGVGGGRVEFANSSIFASTRFVNSICTTWSGLNLGNEARIARNSSNEQLRRLISLKSCACLLRIVLGCMPMRRSSGFLFTRLRISVSR